MKVGLYGGSFDPIHNGHILPVQGARRLLGLDKVIYLPTARPPHKPRRRFAPAYARYAMVELALLPEEGLFVCPYELTLDRSAYTVETVEHFQATLPGAELYLLMGADSFAEIEQWYRWQDLVQAVDLGVLVRPGWDPWEESSRPQGLPGQLVERWQAGRIHFLANSPLSVSSTQLRQLLAQGQLPPPGLMPETVLHYVQKYSLYQ